MQRRQRREADGRNGKLGSCVPGRGAACIHANWYGIQAGTAPPLPLGWMVRSAQSRLTRRGSLPDRSQFVNNCKDLRDILLFRVQVGVPEPRCITTSVLRGSQFDWRAAELGSLDGANVA